MEDNKKTSGKTPVERLWTPIFLLTIGVTLCITASTQGVSSGTSIYLTYIGEGTALAGAGAAAFSLAAAAARAVVGPALDNRGRQIVMMIGIIVLLVGTVCPLFDYTGGFVILWRILQGIGFAAAATATSTIAADVLPYKFLGAGIGYFGLGQALANALGPALAVFLVNTDPHENLFWGVTALVVLAFIMGIFIHYEKNPSKLPATSEYRVRWEREHGVNVADPGEEGFEAIEAEGADKGDAKSSAGADADASKKKGGKADAKGGSEFPREDEEQFQRRIQANPILRLMNKSFDLHAYRGAFPMACLSACFSFGVFFMALYGTTLGVGNAGLFFTISAVVMLIIRLNSGKFMDKLPSLIIIWFAAICGFIAYFVLFGCGSGWFGGATEIVFFLAAVPYGLCTAVAMPISLTMSVKCSDPARWGAANAMYYFCYDIAMAVGSFAWGIFNDALGFAPTLIFVMCMALLSMVVAWLCYPKSARPFAKKRENQ